MITQMTQPKGILRGLYMCLIAMLMFTIVFEPIVLQAQSRRKSKTRDNEETTDRRRGNNQPFSQQTLEDRAAQLEEMGVSQVKITSIGKAAYEALIQSGRYIVGPGDAFIVVAGSGETLEVTEVMVGASGDLIIPNIGAISVATRTLKETQEAIQHAINTQVQNLAIAVSLSRLRAFPVNVHGEVQFPGAYGVNGIEQVSELIMRAGGLIDEPNRRAAVRNIQIRQFHNGQWQNTNRRADLLLWNLTGKEEYNPYLLDGDQIYVPTLQDSINISGAVYQPGNYEYAPGDRILDLLTLGGGLIDASQSVQAQLLRLSTTGNWAPIQIDLHQALNGNTEANMPLQANDKLHILGQEQWVSVEGEVRFPGAYPIEQGLTLRQLLNRTQLKSEASLAQASLIRKVDYTKKVEDEEDVVLTRLLAIPRNQLTDAEEALITLKTQQVSGRLPIDFNKLMNDANSTDIDLRDGDIIRIPRFVSSVRVFGAVQAPANIPYNASTTIQYYIDAAGGFTDRARLTDIYLIKGNTETSIKSNLTTPVDPGDAIYIPTKVETPGQGYRIFREVLAVSGTVASLILTIVAIRR